MPTDHSASPSLYNFRGALPSVNGVELYVARGRKEMRLI